MPASALVAWTGWGGNPRQYTFDFISGEMWSGQYLWGYLMTAIAVFLMPLVLLAHRALARDRRPARSAGRAGRARRLLAAAVAGRDAGADRASAPWRPAAGGAPDAAGAGAVLAVAGRGDRARRLLLPAARPLDAVLGAGREVERGGRPAGVELAVVGDRADAARRWPLPGRARLPAAGAVVAGAGGARLAARRARSSTSRRSARSPTTRSRASRSRSAILAVQGVRRVWRRPRPRSWSRAARAA